MSREADQFAADVLESIKQAGRAEYAQVHTPELIALRRVSLSHCVSSGDMLLHMKH